jgi:NAD(P)H dehydrogenase (quinone)
MRSIRLIFTVLAVLAVSPVPGQQGPVRILVAYHSITGNTEKLAQAIRDGGKSVSGVEFTVQKIADIKDEAILQCNGIVIGSPVHWANISAETRQFLDRLANVLAKGKVWGEGRTAGVFCTAGNVSSGKDTARLSIISALLAMRFVVIGGVDAEGYGILGPQATTAAGDPGISNAELEEAHRFGDRFARLTRQLRGAR